MCALPAIRSVDRYVLYSRQGHTRFVLRTLLIHTRGFAAQPIEPIDMLPLRLTPITLLASIAFAALVGCSNPPNQPATPPPATTPPAGVTFIGGAFGGACTGDFYIGAGTGWAFCDNSVWAYTTSNPAGYGYAELFPTADGGTTPCPDGGTFTPYNQQGQQGGGQVAAPYGACF